MLTSFHMPHYFAGKIRGEIEHLYASMAIGNLAQALIVIFEPIFLYSVLGFTLEQILLFMAAVYGLYALIIPLGGKIAARFGYAHSIFFSIPFQIIYWACLIGSQYNVQWLYFAPLIFAIQKSLFWPAFHSTIARFASSNQIGREFSVMYSIMSFMQIIGPLAGGYLAVEYGMSAAFGASVIIYLLSAVPLFWSREVFHSGKYHFEATWNLYKKYPAKFASYLGFGEELLVVIVVPIFIFSMVKNYEDVGAMVTVSSLIALALALFIGHYIDHHSKRKAAKLGGLLNALSWLARVPAISPISVVLADAFSRTSKSLVFVPMSAVTYQRAESTHILPYAVGFEQILAFGKFLAALVGIIVFALTGSYVFLFLVGALFSLLFLLI